MSDKIFDEEDVFTLIDEDGTEQKFSLLGSCELEGVEYLALVPMEDNNDDYVILKLETDENGEDMLVTIDDDDEFDRVADIFEDELFNEIDYDDTEEK